MDRVSVRPAPSGRSSATSPRRVRPAAGASRAVRRNADLIRARDRPTWCPRTQGIEQLGGSWVTRCSWGGPNGRAPAANSRPRTARRTSPRCEPARRRRDAGRGRVRPDSTRTAGSKFNSMVYPRGQGSAHRGGLGRGAAQRATDAGVLGVADGARFTIRSEHGEMAPGHIWRRSGPATCRSSSPRGTCSCPAPARPAPGSPTTPPRRHRPRTVDQSRAVCQLAADGARRTARDVRRDLRGDHPGAGTRQGAERRARTARPGQYAIDLIADEAALSIMLAPTC